MMRSDTCSPYPTPRRNHNRREKIHDWIGSVDRINTVHSNLRADKRRAAIRFKRGAGRRLLRPAPFGLPAVRIRSLWSVIVVRVLLAAVVIGILRSIIVLILRAGVRLPAVIIAALLSLVIIPRLRSAIIIGIPLSAVIIRLLRVAEASAIIGGDVYGRTPPVHRPTIKINPIDGPLTSRKTNSYRLAAGQLAMEDFA